jgi:exopolyphosphatase/guanosine-5'-triphosphate,3'-diphosphate pyrophosphatase
MTAEQLHSLLTEFIQAKHISQLNYAALSDKRRSVIVPGLCALTAIVDMLAIEKLSYCDYALRDGLLAELTESVRYHDVRERTIQSLQQRFSVDQQQANNVVAIAQDILRALESKCQSSEMIYTKLLRWSCLLHEIGLDINSSDFHIHGSYIIKHTDLAGFTLEQQYALAWLIRNQRKKIQPINAKYLHQLSGSQLNRLLVILRLSVLLAQQRNLVNVSNVAFAFQSDQLEIRLPQDWLTQRQLLMNQLLNEQRVAKKLGLQLQLCVEASLRSDAVENGN